MKVDHTNHTLFARMYFCLEWVGSVFHIILRYSVSKCVTILYCLCVCVVVFLFFRAAVEFLCNEGHIYSTIDDEHFKSTDT